MTVVKEGVFSSALAESVYLKEVVKACFVPYAAKQDAHFNVCQLHQLETYGSDFADWARAHHCRTRTDIGDSTWKTLQLYVINYVLLPNAVDEWELEAMWEELFGEPEPKERVRWPWVARRFIGGR